MTDVRVTDAGRDGAIVADAVLTSAVLVPEGGPPNWARPAHMQAPPPDGELPSWIDWLGVREVAGAPAGVVELDASRRAAQPVGHRARRRDGGAGRRGRRSARARRTSAFRRTPSRPRMSRCTSSRRRGSDPVRASATVLGDRADGVVLRIEVRDVGKDRVAAHAVATVRPR